jgi:hypothetical protein
MNTMNAALRIVENTPESINNLAVTLTMEYTAECGFRPLPWMVREFFKLLSEGFEPDMLSEVIARTARAPKPSWAYLAAVIRNARAAQAFGLTAFLATQPAARSRSVSAQQYEQRNYTEEELLAVSEDLIAEARKIKGE